MVAPIDNNNNYALKDSLISPESQPVVKQEEIKVAETPIAVEALHKTDKEPSSPAKAVTTEHQELFHKLIHDPNTRNVTISGVNGLLHALATVTNFMAKKDKKFGAVNSIVDGAAFLCTQWLAPILSYGITAANAFSDNKGVLGVIKAIPVMCLPLVGKANIDMVYGSSTALNQPHDMALDRITRRAEKDPEFAKLVAESNKTMLGNANILLQEFKHMVRDFLNGTMPFRKEGLFMINCSMILAGSLPVMLFARNARDTMFAKSMGILRNLGGVMGDIGFMVGGKSLQILIGSLCSVAATADIMKRWVSEDMAKVLIHLGAGLNVSAYALWNAFNSKKPQTAPKPEIVPAAEMPALPAEQAAVTEQGLAA